MRASPLDMRIHERTQTAKVGLLVVLETRGRHHWA